MPRPPVLARQNAAPHAGWRALRLPCALLLASVIVMPLLLSPVPAPGQAMAVVYPPWWSLTHAAQAVAEAGGALLRPGRWGWIVVAQAGDPGFTRRLKRGGAWLLLDPRVAAGCLASATAG